MGPPCTLRCGVVVVDCVVVVAVVVAKFRDRACLVELRIALAPTCSGSLCCRRGLSRWRCELYKWFCTVSIGSEWGLSLSHVRWLKVNRVTQKAWNPPFRDCRFQMSSKNRTSNSDVNVDEHMVETPPDRLRLQSGRLISHLHKHFYFLMVHRVFTKNAGRMCSGFPGNFGFAYKFRKCASHLKRLKRELQKPTVYP